MKKLRASALLALAALLCGCRQQESGTGAATVGTTPSAAAPKAASPVDNRPEIACFGDSLTAGMGLDPGQSFPDLLQRDLDRQGYRYRVANFGVSGDTTQDGLARLSLVVADKPALVVLELGANDGLRGLPVDVTRDNLEQIVTALQGAGARVILAGMTLPPNYGPSYIARFQAVFSGVAARHKLTLIPFLLQGVGGNAALMQRDGLHPNAEGTRIVAASVLKTLVPFLQR